jgi:RNA polymerase sigma factor (TIGR02999 family)
LECGSPEHGPENAANRDLATATLLPLVYQELRLLAAKYISRKQVGISVQPTALVHEAYLRMADGRREWRSEAHFMAIAAIAMRNVLVDHARRKTAQKRGGGVANITLGSCEAVIADKGMEVLELDELLTRLAQLDPRRARVVELKFFAGMTNEQISEALDIARSTVADDWAVARAWLAAELRDR